MFHAIALALITLTAHVPHRAPVQLPAITVVGKVKCAASEWRYDIRNPFTGRAAYFCAAQPAK